MKRRTVLLTAAAAPFALAAMADDALAGQTSAAKARIAALEKTSGGRIGVYAVDTGNGAVIAHRAEQRFPLCSTFKVMLAAAILERSARAPGLLQRRIRYRKRDLVTYSPISEKHVGGDGMTIADLCAAAIQHSDNTAANLLMTFLGGPPAVTAFARSIGNRTFRLDRWETELNTAIPGDPRDTVTPAAMAASLRSLTLGTALPPAQTQRLNVWLRGNTTGAKRIRAAVPVDWQVGDKTGTGDYGTTNDIGVLYPPKRKPIVLAIYYTASEQKARSRDDVIAATAGIVADAFRGPTAK